ncbi:hypothetical protein AB0878_44940 [Amycolatopsis sp. NPDC047767]|uniref:hypothetical protein n=1 Tax=Amycolatopsis sp. NPDC047767 TaxID=3156765 RepID=UPI003454AD9A
MPHSRIDLTEVRSHVHRVARANDRLGITWFHEMSHGAARTLARAWHRQLSDDVEMFLSEGVVPYDPSRSLWPSLLPIGYAELSAADRVLADHLGTYLIRHAGRDALPGWPAFPTADLRDDADGLEDWCVVTESGVCYLVPYRGNGGFGPVNVWHEGNLVRTRTRHRLADTRCPVCASPDRRRAYLPPALWRTPDLTGIPRRVPLDPNRGVFRAVFSGGAGHPSGCLTVDVHRLSAWHTWDPYGRTTLTASEDWRDAFDLWRAQVTGFRLPPAS